MNDQDVKIELERIEEELLNEESWQSVVLTRSWAKTQSQNAGVYILIENQKIVYVGETGKISERLTDMLDSRHHTVRRSIGEKYFSEESGYEKATSKKKFPVEIENLVENHLRKFKISMLPINFGRKEFEEYIFEKHTPSLNIKLKRGGKHKSNS